MRHWPHPRCLLAPGDLQSLRWREPAAAARDADALAEAAFPGVPLPAGPLPAAACRAAACRAADPCPAMPPGPAAAGQSCRHLQGSSAVHHRRTCPDLSVPAAVAASAAPLSDLGHPLNRGPSIGSGNGGGHRHGRCASSRGLTACGHGTTSAASASPLLPKDLSRGRGGTPRGGTPLEAQKLSCDVLLKLLVR